MAEVNDNQSRQTQLNEEKTGKSRRGFASMDKDRHKKVSSKGGQSPRSNRLPSDRQPTGYDGF